MSEEHPASAQDGAGDADDLDTLDDLLGLEPEEIDPLADVGESQPQPEEQPAPQPQPSRGERRVQVLRQRLREQEDEVKRLRELALTQARAPQVSQPQSDPYRQAQLEREEQERLAQMMPHEAAQYVSRKAEERLNGALLRTNLETRDMLDRIQFQNLMRDRKLPSSYNEQVENLLAQARRENMNPSREWLLRAVIGDQVLSRQGKDAGKQRETARRRLAAQTTQPGVGRSTAPAPARRQQGEESWQEFTARLKSTRLSDL